MKQGILILIPILIAGCAQIDRHYSGSYDATTGDYGATISFTPAARPGQGTPHVNLRVTGSKNVIPKHDDSTLSRY